MVKNTEFFIEPLHQQEISGAVWIMDPTQKNAKLIYTGCVIGVVETTFEKSRMAWNPSK